MKFIPLALIHLMSLSYGMEEDSIVSSCNLRVGARDPSDVRHRRMVSIALDESCETSEVISIDVPHDGRKHSFKKVTSITRAVNLENGLRNVPSPNVVSNYGYWYGEDSSDGSTFNYVQDADGNMMGSLLDMTTGNVMQFQIEDGEPTVIIRTPSDIPDLLDPIENSTEPSIKFEDDRSLLSSTGSSGTNYLRRGAKDTKLFTFGHEDKINQQGPSSRSLVYDDAGGNLDIMVVWTKDAECRNAGLPIGCTLTAKTEALMQSRINLAIQETNTAYRLSGIETELLLVHSYRHPTFVSNDNFSGSLSEMNSCRMSGLCENRETYGADLVAMLIEGSSYCGVAALGPRFMDSFSVTAWDCATGIFAFGHEIGHNLGIRHDRGTHNACSAGGINYGYRDPQARFKTIMAYSCKVGQCDNMPSNGCVTLQRFSNLNFDYMGDPVGTAKEDAATYINWSRKRVAGFLPHRQSPTQSPLPLSSNAALNKPTLQSSTQYRGKSSRAVDGNTDGDFLNGSVTHTEVSSNPFWQVDLIHTYLVEDIRVFNRLDGYKSRLDNFKIVLYNNGNEAWTYQHNGVALDVDRVSVPSIEANLLKIILEGSNKVLSLAEVEVYGELLVTAPTKAPSIPNTSQPSQAQSFAPSSVSVSSVNVALNKPATQSSTRHGGEASRAVDGNTSGYWPNRSTTHTALNTNPWWQVDLLGVFKIHAVKVFNRQACCPERLSGFAVAIFRDGNEVWRKATSFDSIPGHETIVNVPMVLGDLVKITIPEPRRVLSMAEVEVYSYVNKDPTISPSPTILESAVPSISHTPTIAPSASPSKALSLAPSSSHAPSSAPSVDDGLPPNVALSKPASQSSTRHNAAASRAVDGNTSGTWAEGSVTHTAAETDPFWQVDLLNKYMISSIKVFNRADCCSDRLRDFQLVIYDEGNEVWSQTYAGIPPAETTLSVPSVMGDEVKIMLTGSGRVLSLAEVEVYGDLMVPPVENVALNKPAIQSSTRHNAAASRAVDGNTSGIWGNGSVTHTAGEANPFWQVDLLDKYMISSIKVFNRADSCCSDRLRDFQLVIYDEGNEVWSQTYAGIPPDVTTLSVPSVMGDQVKVTLSGSIRVLSLAEVEVYGVVMVPPVENVALNKPAVQSSTRHNAAASRAVDGNTSGSWADGSVTHTAGETDPFWQVDLLDSFIISSIKVFNRADCCSNRLQNFMVMIYSDDAEVWSQTYAGIPPAETTLSVPSVVGDEVKIMLTGSGRVLSLAEVEVYGFAA